MNRRHFLVNLLLWILAFFFGYKVKEEGENMTLFNQDTRMVMDTDGKPVSEKLLSLSDNAAIVLRPTGGDDTHMINDAIIIASNNDRRKKVILNGEFKVSIANGYPYAINMKSNVELEFMTWSKLILEGNNLTTYRVILCDEIENWKIIDPYIIGDRDTHIGTTGEWGHGIYVRGCRNFKMTNVYVEKCWGDGVVFGNGSVSGLSNVGGYVNSIKTYKCRRNGTVIASGQDIRIDYIEGIEIDGTAPMAALDIESNTINEVWKNIKIGKVKSHLCPGGVKIQPYGMAENDYTSYIDLQIDNIEITGNTQTDTGSLVFYGVNHDKIKGKVRIGKLYQEKKIRGLVFEQFRQGGFSVHIDRVELYPDITGTTDSFGLQAAIYISVHETFYSTKNVGDIYIGELLIGGNAPYSIRVMPQTSGMIERSGLKIGQFINKVKPMYMNGFIHEVTRDPQIECNVNELSTTYRPGYEEFTYHFYGNLYHNEGATSDKQIKASNNPGFYLKETPVTVEVRSSHMLSFVFLGTPPIYPASLAFSSGFKSDQVGSRITFILKEDGSIHILEMLGTWQSFL